MIKILVLTLCAYVTLILVTPAAAMTGDQQIHNKPLEQYVL